MEKLRTCTKCKEQKPIKKFPKEAGCVDGRRHQCTKCRNTGHRQRHPIEVIRAKQRAYFATPAGQAARKRGMKKWLASEKGKAYDHRRYVKEYRSNKSRLYRKRNPLKCQARDAVKQARRRGLIPPIKGKFCRHCGLEAQQYHHHKGYERDNWLEVIPLCKPCHRKADSATAA